MCTKEGHRSCVSDHVEGAEPQEATACMPAAGKDAEGRKGGGDAHAEGTATSRRATRAGWPRCRHLCTMSGCHEPHAAASEHAPRAHKPEVE